MSFTDYLRATSPLSFEVSFDLKDYFKEKSMPSSTPTPASVINDINTIAKDSNVDLSGIKATVASREAERKERIEKSLQGVADLAVLPGTKAKRFVVVYWQNSEATTVEGIEYPVERDDDGAPIGSNVQLRSGGHSLYGRYSTMEKFRETLNNGKIPHTIAYFDK